MLDLHDGQATEREIKEERLLAALKANPGPRSSVPSNYSRTSEPAIAGLEKDLLREDGARARGTNRALIESVVVARQTSRLDRSIYQNDELFGMLV